MQWKAQRCISKNGNSYSFALPRQVLMKMGLMRGDLVELTFDCDTCVLRVEAVDAPRRTLHGLRPARGMREVNP